tara:strand:- start:1079 stop:1270 length:192 start_codon:yes stop_codon:yes gene_type:complete
MRSRRFSSKNWSKLVIKRKRSQKKSRQYGGNKRGKKVKEKTRYLKNGKVFEKNIILNIESTRK